MRALRIIRLVGVCVVVAANGILHATKPPFLYTHVRVCTHVSYVHNAWRVYIYKYIYGGILMVRISSAYLQRAGDI